MKRAAILSAALVCVASSAFAEAAETVPQVSDVVMTQDKSTREVTISYKLSGGLPAVVTLDVQTNAEVDVWASIGGENISCLEGAVNRIVTADDADDGVYTIKWHPDRSWNGHRVTDGGARAVVKAWALDDKPDYLVVSLVPDAIVRKTYYPSAEFLPGGLLTNPDYRTNKVVLRRIHAKNVPWTMGTICEYGRDPKDGRETTRQIVLSNDYYLAVFETTQAQWALVYGDNASNANFKVEGEMRPMERVSYGEVRENSVYNSASKPNRYPGAPHAGSYLGKLRTRTGVDFDLPGEAQWEFAARAGHGEGYWGDGSPLLRSTTDANLAKLGRVKFNGGLIDGKEPPVDVGPTNGTAIVGSYLPNSWGLYDMHGNVWEWVLDWQVKDNGTLAQLGGRVNGNIDKDTYPIMGTANKPDSVVYRMKRGGCYSSASIESTRAGYRSGDGWIWRQITTGFRLACGDGLK